MGRLAIFIDGGYLDKLAQDEFGVRVDMAKLSAAVSSAVAGGSQEPLDLLRTLYYCPPYQSNPPTAEEAARFGQARKFYRMLTRLPRFEVREGRLAFRGLDAVGKPIFQQSVWICSWGLISHSLRASIRFPTRLCCLATAT